MSNRLGELDLEEAAVAAAGNWHKFDCFAWFRQAELDDSENWAVIYTHHRDSDLLDESNAAVIAKALEPFCEQEPADVVFESHSHWAVGHVDGFSIRVLLDGKITNAFKAYHALAQRLADYPILNEADYGRRETEATLANLPEAAWRLKHNFKLPDDWPSEVYDWLSNYRPSAVENADDRGGYPKESDLEAAFIAIGYERVT